MGLLTCPSVSEAADMQPVEVHLSIDRPGRDGEGGVVGVNPPRLKVLHVHPQLVVLLRGEQVDGLQTCRGGAERFKIRLMRCAASVNVIYRACAGSNRRLSLW